MGTGDCMYYGIGGTKDYPGYYAFGLWYYSTITQVLMYKNSDNKCKYYGMDKKADGLDDAPPNYFFNFKIEKTIDEVVNKKLNDKTAKTNLYDGYESKDTRMD